MKVWKKIADLNNGQMQIFTNSCPAELETKYKIIGEKRFNRHCEIGCGVECTKEYLNLTVK